MVSFEGERLLAYNYNSLDEMRIEQKNCTEGPIEFKRPH